MVAVTGVRNGFGAWLVIYTAAVLFAQSIACTQSSESGTVVPQVLQYNSLPVEISLGSPRFSNSITRLVE